MRDDELDDSRRGFLKCMAWAGTGALFAFDGGIGSSIGLDTALAAPHRTAAAPFTFAQLSDSHIGFNKAAERRRSRHVRRGDRQGESASPEARLHHPYR